MIKYIGPYTVYAIGIIYGKLPERVKKQFSLIYLSQVVFKCVYIRTTLSLEKKYSEKAT